MTYQRDPRRNLRPGESSAPLIIIGVLAAAFIMLVAISFWPTTDNRTGVATNMDRSTRVERPATPAPPPAANKPQTDLKPTTSPPAKAPAQ
jgi:hypothetical protein